MKSSAVLFVSAAVLSQVVASAVLVREISVDPRKTVSISVTGGNYGGGDSTYSGNALAGVVNITVDNVPMDAFCIDPFHFSSSSPLDYEYVPLQFAPKGGLSSGYDGPMEVSAAGQISKLWAMAYTPSITAFQAAALQLAIWEVVGGIYFQWNDTAPSQYTVYDRAQELINAIPSYTGTANLVALRSITQNGQDYVVANVPDGGSTAALLGIALAGFAVARKRNQL